MAETETVDVIDNIDKEDSPMIGELCNPSVLEPEYRNAVLPGYRSGIDYLVNNFKGLRKVRRDGNCFYRYFFIRMHSIVITTNHFQSLFI